jgi:hypothetical protein
MKQLFALLLVTLLVGFVIAHPVVTLDGFVTVIVDTNGSTLADYQCCGQVIVNTGAGGPQTHILPPVVAGMHVTFAIATGQTVTVNPYQNNRILALTNAPGDAIASDTTIGTSVELVGIDTTNWLPISRVGTWSDAN